MRETRATCQSAWRRVRPSEPSAPQWASAVSSFSRSPAAAGEVLGRGEARDRLLALDRVARFLAQRLHKAQAEAQRAVRAVRDGEAVYTLRRS